MMPMDMAQKLKQSILKHEECRKYPYVDTVGKITIGYGYNLSDRGIDDGWIDKQYLDDVTYFYNQLRTLTWFDHLNEDRQIILVDMCFMGWKRFCEFVEMFEAIATENWEEAAKQILNSLWAKEVGQRAIDLAHGMLTGVYTI